LINSRPNANRQCFEAIEKIEEFDNADAPKSNNSEVRERKTEKKSKKVKPFSTRKDVIYKTIFRYMRKFYKSEFKEYYNLSKKSAKDESTFCN
jgi:hypothetical protein